MSRIRMVHLLTVQSAFQGRVLAARLGSEGVVVQLRGAVEGPYPFGEVRVEVSEDDLDTARELLLADEVDSVFEADAEPRPPVASALTVCLTVVAIVAMVAFSVVARLL